jgi:hypothetical protein
LRLVREDDELPRLREDGGIIDEKDFVDERPIASPSDEVADEYASRSQQGKGCYYAEAENKARKRLPKLKVEDYAQNGGAREE